MGHGGITIVYSDRRSAATGMSRSAITQGIAETAHPEDAAPPAGQRRVFRQAPEPVRRTLKRLGYRMQGNRKVKSGGADHPDRDAQFQHITRTMEKAIKSENPVISVDTKKKEVPGAWKNGGKRAAQEGGKPRGGGP